MRFPNVFYRSVGTTSPQYAALGSDNAPTPSAAGALAFVQPPVEPSAQADNVLVCKAFQAGGAPVQRIGVLYGYVGAGTAPAITASMYFLEETTGLWFHTDALAKTLVVGGVTYFDVQPISDMPVFAGGARPGFTPDQTLYTAQSSSLRYMLVPALVGAVNGIYAFGMAPLAVAGP